MKQAKKKEVSKKIVVKLTKAQQARIKKLVDSIVADILKRATEAPIIAGGLP